MPQDRPSITSHAQGTPASAEPIRGVGLGIENLATYPEVENYLEDAFYRARFTPAEIAYCAGQESPSSSFCTLAAVKRAVLKAEAVTATPEHLAAIEISCDEAGNPTRPDCLVSVDHSETGVVAMCLWMRESNPPLPVIQGRTLGSYPPLQRLGIRAIMGLTALSLLFVFGAGVWFILGQIFH